MVLIPKLSIAGADYSRYFLTSHSEQTTNDTKDENKYDITLANVGGRLFGKFKPTDEVVLSITNRRQTCEGNFDENIKILSGEVQNVACDEIHCKIQGSCSQGGMVSGLVQHKTWAPDTSISECVMILLADFGFTGNKVIIPKNNKPLEHTPECDLTLDFNTAIQDLADAAQCIWFFDEHDTFWFVPPASFRGSRDVTGHLLAGQLASNMCGLCTVVNVIGGSAGYKPPEKGSVIKTHNLVHAQAKADEDTLLEYGEIVAPPIYVPNCDQETCQRIADNALQWFQQYQDVPQIKLTGIAPVVMSLVSYRPFNGKFPPSSCDEGASDIAMGPMIGLVTRRVIDISANTGLICTLDLDTHFEEYKGEVNVYGDPDYPKTYEGVMRLT